MSNVGDVHNTGKVIAVALEGPAQQIHKYVCAHVSNMCIAVNGRSAGIHANAVAVDGL